MGAEPLKLALLPKAGSVHIASGILPLRLTWRSQSLHGIPLSTTRLVGQYSTHLSVNTCTHHVSHRSSRASLAALSTCHLHYLSET